MADQDIYSTDLNGNAGVRIALGAVPTDKNENWVILHYDEVVIK